MFAFMAVIVASILLAVCTALQPIYIQNAINACVSGDLAGLFAPFLIFILYTVGILLFEAIRQLSIGKYKTVKTKALKKGVLQTLLHLDMKAYRQESGQNYITTLNQEIDMLVDNYYLERLEMTYSILVLITSTCALFYINAILAVIILAMTFLPILMSSLQGKRIQMRTNLYTESLKKFNVMVGSLIQGFPTIKVNRVEEKYSTVLEAGNEEASRAKFNEIKTKTFVNMLIGSLAYLGQILLIGVAAVLIAKGKLTAGALIGALQISEMLAIPTNSIAYQLNDIQSVGDIRKRVLALAEQRPRDEKLAPCPPIERLEMKGVSFRYEDKLILSDLSVSFEAKKKYLIIGESGSGKSTIFKLFSRFETDYDGSVLVNGADLKGLDDSYFDRLGIILQTPFLFSDTLRNNLTLYQDRDEAEIKAVLERLELSNFLANHSLDESYQDTKDSLSGGEKQKLSLARVLLQHKDFILLDEATSAIDPASSYTIEKALLTDPDKTIINIEHKIIEELLPLYDEVFEIQAGVLIRKR